MNDNHHMIKTPFITHSGIVERIAPDGITVRIHAVSACAACHAKGFCSISDTAEKRVEVPNTGQPVTPGEEVNVTLRPSAGLSAVAWAYVLPMAVLLAILAVLQGLSLPDVYNGAAAVGGVALYYGVLYAFRKRWKRKYVFEIEKIK